MVGHSPPFALAVVVWSFCFFLSIFWHPIRSLIPLHHTHCWCLSCLPSLLCRGLLLLFLSLLLALDNLADAVFVARLLAGGSRHSFWTRLNLHFERDHRLLFLCKMSTQALETAAVITPPSGNSSCLEHVQMADIGWSKKRALGFSQEIQVTSSLSLRFERIVIISLQSPVRIAKDRIIESRTNITVLEGPQCVMSTRRLPLFRDRSSGICPLVMPARLCHVVGELLCCLQALSAALRVCATTGSASGCTVWKGVVLSFR